MGRDFPDEAPRPPGGSGATYRSRQAAGAAQTRVGSPARRSRGEARPSGIARLGLGANAPRAAARGVPGHRRLCASGEEGGAAPSPSHSKATRTRSSGSAQPVHRVQGGDPPTTLACCATLAAPTPEHPLRSRSPPAPGGAGKSRPPPPTSLVRHRGSRAGLCAPLAPRLTQTRPPGVRASWGAHDSRADPRVQSGDGQLRVLHLGTLRVPHAEEGGRCERRS